MDSDQSPVGMGHSVCPVCGCHHDEVVLISKRLDMPVPRDAFMGFNLCPEHKAKFDEGYLAMVVVNGGPPRGSDLLTQFNWSATRRTGEIVHVKRELAAQIFNCPLPATLPFAWCEPEMLQVLKSMILSQFEDVSGYSDEKLEQELFAAKDPGNDGVAQGWLQHLQSEKQRRGQ